MICYQTKTGWTHVVCVCYCLEYEIRIDKAALWYRLSIFIYAVLPVWPHSQVTGTTPWGRLQHTDTPHTMPCHALPCCGRHPRAPRDGPRGKPYLSLYQWTILMSVFLAHFLSCGISYCLGIYYLPILEVFQQSHGVTAWIGSLNTATLCGTGLYMIHTIYSYTIHT